MSNDRGSRAELLEGLDMQYLLHPNQSFAASAENPPLIVERGEGPFVWDIDGRQYIDSTATLWLSNVGHGRPEIASVMAEQASRLEFFHTFWEGSNVPAVELAARLAALSPGDLNHVSFCAGGSEANETAIKMARFYFESIGEPARKAIIGRKAGYHGTSYGALTATGIADLHAGFGKLLPDFQHIEPPYCYRCPLNQAYPACNLACAELLDDAIRQTGPDQVAAFIAEPIMGVGGVIDPPDGYFQRIRAICDRYGILLIADEVITAFGRTGKRFGIEHWGVVPDIMSVAKGITSGYFPLGATMLGDKVYEGIRSNPRVLSHGFTYSGHPVGCAVALKNLEIIEAENLVEAAATKGAFFRSALDRLRELPWVGDIRGRGLMVGVELVADQSSRRRFPESVQFGARLKRYALSEGLLCRAVHDIVALSPPLVTDDATLLEIVRRLEQAIGQAAAEVQAEGVV